MALSRVISEIFDVEECRDLEIGVKGHSRSTHALSANNNDNNNNMTSLACCKLKLQGQVTKYNLIAA